MEEIKLYDKVCSGRFGSLDNKIDRLDSKFERVNDKFDKLNDKVETNQLALLDKIETNQLAILDRIEPLTNFKFRVIGAVSVVVVIISITVSYTIATIKAKEVVKKQNTIKQI